MRLPTEGDELVRESQTRNFLQQLMLLSHRLGVPTLVLAQLGPDLQRRHDNRPCFLDFKSYEPVEEYADTDIFLYRDELYDPNSYDAGITEVIFAKDRYGPMGTAKLAFLQRQGRYTSVPTPLRASYSVLQQR